MLKIFNKQKALLEITLLAALFAPSFLFIKIAVQDITPITVIALRITIAGLLLYFVLKLKGTVIPKKFNLWKHCFVLGILINGPPFLCFSYALIHIPTSLSALINGLTPVLTVFLANIFLADERLTQQKVFAVISGLVGFLILFLPTLLQNSFTFDSLGILLCFIGAMLYAVGAIYARKYVPKAPPLVAPTLQLLTSLIYLIPLAFIFESPLEAFDAPLSAWAAILGVSIVGTMLAFIMYHRVINKYGATFVAMSTFLLPVFGAIIGLVFLNETLSIQFIIAALLILNGVGVINGLIPIPFLKKLSKNQLAFRENS